MKTFPRLLAFLVLPFITVATLFAASGPAASPHSFGLYLVEVAPSGTSDVNTPLADLTLSAEPLISERDVAAYDWESHTIHLKQQEVADRVLKRKEMSRSRGFVIVADGQRLYLGTLLSPVANSIPDTPVIHFGDRDREYQLESAVRIDPPMISGKTDTRSDPRLKRVLEALQLLSAEPGEKPASSGSNSAIQFIYGPVIERFIAAGNGDKSFYSIERDAYVPGPKDFPALPSFEDFVENESAKAVVARYSKWLADNDVDCFVQMIASKPGLTLSGMKLQGTFFEHFDDPATVLLELFKNDLRPQDRLNLHNMGGPSAESRSDAPTTVFFQTRNGRVGVAQVVGRTENPRGVNIRYKLVEKLTTDGQR